MALKAVLASLDGLAEHFKGEYKQGQDGKYYLDVTEVEEMPVLQGLRQNNTALLDELKPFRRILREQGLLGEKFVEAELESAIKTLKDKASAAHGTGATAERVRELEARITQMSEQSQREIAAAKEEGKQAREAAENSFLELAITQQLADDETRGSADLLMPAFRPSVKVKRVTGADGVEKMMAVVVRPDGTERVKDSAGNPFTLKDLAMELRENPRWGRGFDAPGTSGSGPAPNGGPGGGGGGGGSTPENPWKADSKNLTRQMEIAKKDPALARRLMGEAGVKVPKDL
jgi:hypothetical protein